MSRIEANSYVLQEQTANIANIITTSIADVESRAVTCAVTITRDLADGLPPAVVDVNAIRQVLINLLSNAIKFSARDTTVTVSAHIEEGGALAISIRDHGIGIPADKLRQLFTPFAQLDTGTSHHYDGTGLGLAIVKGLMDLHGGTISIISRQGTGSTVTLHLPASRIDMG
ncbi:hypothetical protein CCP1ISM_3350001 [Azospirillaceae bacterium]